MHAFNLNNTYVKILFNKNCLVDYYKNQRKFDSHYAKTMMIQIEKNLYLIFKLLSYLFF